MHCHYRERPLSARTEFSVRSNFHTVHSWLVWFTMKNNQSMTASVVHTQVKPPSKPEKRAIEMSQTCYTATARACPDEKPCIEDGIIPKDFPGRQWASDWNSSQARYRKHDCLSEKRTAQCCLVNVQSDSIRHWKLTHHTTLSRQTCEFAPYLAKELRSLMWASVLSCNCVARGGRARNYTRCVTKKQVFASYAL